MSGLTNRKLRNSTHRMSSYPGTCRINTRLPKTNRLERSRRWLRSKVRKKARRREKAGRRW